MKNAKDKANTLVQDTKASFSNGAADANKEIADTLNSATATTIEADAETTAKAKSNEPPKPPYPQSSNNKQDSKNKEKVKADKAFSTEEQQKDGKTKSYTEGGDAADAATNKQVSYDDDDATIPVKEKVKSSEETLNTEIASSSGKCDAKSKYVVMVDAGSSGSRVHVYEFDVCFSPPKLLREEFKMLKPGLSSFDTDTIGAAKSLDPLLEVAVKTVPKESQGCTPIAVKATAGLRLLGKEKSDAILKQVRKYLETEWPFAVVESDGISIMDGADEGVYAWVTANYLIGNIGSKEKTPTAAVFDLGGGSTQIVFEPKFPVNEKLLDGEHKYKIDFGNRNFELYQTSHLGYGLMEGRNKINSLIVESYLKGKNKPSGLKPVSADTKEATVDLISPCIAPGNTAKNVKVKYSDDETYMVNFVGPETATGPQCRFLAEKILNKDAECAQAPCSFNGIHQPSLVRNFQQTSDMYIFSFFYDRTNPLGMPSSFTLEELSDLAKIVCNGNSFWEKMLGSLNGALEELNNEPNYCLDLSFMVAMLHTGYDIPLHRELKTAKKIAGNELGWCLGASLPLLDQKGWKCRIQEEK